MAYANYRIRDLTNSSSVLTIFAIVGLLSGTLLIFYYEFSNQLQQMLFIGGIYIVLTAGSWLYSRAKAHHS